MLFKFYRTAISNFLLFVIFSLFLIFNLLLVVWAEQLLNAITAINKNISFFIFVPNILWTCYSLSTKELLPVSANDILPPLAHIQNDCSVSFFIPLILSFWVVCCQSCGWGRQGGFGELHLQIPKLENYLKPILSSSVATNAPEILRNFD